MKTRLLLLIMTGFFITSCSDDAKLLRDAEKYLKSQLNDPESFRKDSLVIALKVTQLENKKNNINNGLNTNRRLIKNLSESINRDFEDFKSLYLPFMDYIKTSTANDIKKDYENKLMGLNTRKKFIDIKIDSLTRLNDNLTQDSINASKQTEDQVIHSIIIKGVYSAKNSFDANVKQVSWIIWYPEKGFELMSFE